MAAAVPLPGKRFVEVGEGLLAVLHGDGAAGVANAGVVHEGGDALVVDATLLPEMAAGIGDELARRGARAELVLNTHHHLDHVGGNAAFPEARAVAHPVTARIAGGMVGRTAALAAILPRFAAALPDLDLRPPAAWTEPPALPRGGRTLLFTPAHSPADCAVWFPAERVLFAGDVCFNRVVPLAVHASPSAWIAAIDALAALEPAVIVPGHGPLATIADLLALRAYLAALVEVAAAVHGGDLGEREAHDALRIDAVEGWIEADRAAVNLARALAELRAEEQPGDRPETGRHVAPA
ncbi:MAG: MBL fold metallo-hydrolase [Chloroflexi bacterium]|nr:MAG: MBL fold metallo-hydrolase [Chloroflexota bacterium]